jgi:hypothetical protein
VAAQPARLQAGRADGLLHRAEKAETDFLKISKPEDIKVCDPACGSGHMLTYAFDLLYAIYEEEGYDAAEIPEKILTHNLYGIELDERAGELAAFALTMKARAKQRRFFNKRVKPNICVLENGPDSTAHEIEGCHGPFCRARPVHRACCRRCCASSKRPTTSAR